MQQHNEHRAHFFFQQSYNVFFCRTNSFQIRSVGVNMHISSPHKDIRIMFDTGAALHICSWWLEEEFLTCTWTGTSTIAGSDGTSIHVHGVRTISAICCQSEMNMHNLPSTRRSRTNRILQSNDEGRIRMCNVKQ